MPGRAQTRGELLPKLWSMARFTAVAAALALARYRQTVD